MGCSDVCLDMGYDDNNEFFSQKIFTARKQWKCVECGESIPPGEMYERSNGKSDDMIWTESTCLICREIREVFVCGSFCFSMLWETITDEMFPIWETSGPIDCLAKVESREARDVLRQRYDEWSRGGGG